MGFDFRGLVAARCCLRRAKGESPLQSRYCRRGAMEAALCLGLGGGFEGRCAAGGVKLEGTDLATHQNRFLSRAFYQLSNVKMESL
ncbi:hypothetical protein FHW92_001936 [Novosphingobium sp. SG707]|nr:hypothetical protein [Novosphingobium sp. SG707]